MTEHEILQAKYDALRKAVEAMRQTFPAYADALNVACSVSRAHGVPVSEAVIPFTEARLATWALLDAPTPKPDDWGSIPPSCS